MFLGALAVLILAAAACNVKADCIKSFKPLGGGKEVTSVEPNDWISMSIKCIYSGSKLVNSIDSISASDRKLCGGGVVPIGGNDSTDFSMMDTNINDAYDNFNGDIKVLDLTSGLTRSTDPNTKFTCALCQLPETADIESIAYRVYGNFSWEDMSKKYFNVKLVSNDKHNIVQKPTEESRANLAQKIALKLGGVEAKDVVYQSSKLNFNGYLEITFHYHTDNFNDTFYAADFQNVPLDATYVMSVEDISECPEEKVTDSYGGVAIWKSDALTAQQLKMDLTEWIVKQRSCKFNVSADRPLWSLPRVWQIVHEPCSDIEQYANQIKYKTYLDPSFEYNQKHQLQKFTESPSSVEDLAEVARLTSREIRAANGLTSEMHDYLKQILVELQTEGKVAIVQKPSVNFVVADLAHKENAVNGFTLTFETGLGMIVEPITLALNKVSSPNKTEPLPTVSLTVSNGLIDNSDRVAFAALWKPMNSWEFENDDAERFLEVDVILVGSKVSLSTADSFVDIVYNIKNVANATNVSCEAVIEDNVMVRAYYIRDFDDLDVKGCIHLELKSSTDIVCRCETKYFNAEGDVFSGTFRFKETNNYFNNEYYSPSSSQLDDILRENISNYQNNYGVDDY